MASGFGSPVPHAVDGAFGVMRWAGGLRGLSGRADYLNKKVGLVKKTYSGSWPPGLFFQSWTTSACRDASYGPSKPF